MFLFGFFRSFLPLHNPIGFGAADFIELAQAALLVSFVLLRARVEPAFQWLAARAGWSMLALAGIYEVDPSERYLNAMKTLAEDALSEQDPHCGGWLYQLGPGHCNCVTRQHVGEAGFIGCVRLNGLYRYYQLTGDKRIPEVIKRGITHLNNDTWREAGCGWRYTSCPASTPARQPGVTIQALASAVRVADDPEHLRILRIAWNALFERLKASPKSAGAGKAFSSTVYGCPETVSLLASRPES